MVIYLMVAVCGTNLVVLGNSFCPFCPLAPAEKKQPNDPQMTALPFNLQPVLSRWRWSLGLPSPRAAGEAGKNILEAVVLVRGVDSPGHPCWLGRNPLESSLAHSPLHRRQCGAPAVLGRFTMSSTSGCPKVAPVSRTGWRRK